MSTIHTSGTIRIPFTIFISRDVFGSELIYEEGFIGISLVNHNFSDSSATRIYNKTQYLDRVSNITDVIRGPTIIVKDEVVLNYDLMSSVVKRTSYLFASSGIVELQNISRTIVPLFEGNITIVPGI